MFPGSPSVSSSHTEQLWTGTADGTSGKQREHRVSVRAFPLAAPALPSGKRKSQRLPRRAGKKKQAEQTTVWPYPGSHVAAAAPSSLLLLVAFGFSLPAPVTPPAVLKVFSAAVAKTKTEAQELVPRPGRAAVPDPSVLPVGPSIPSALPCCGQTPSPLQFLQSPAVLSPPQSLLTHPVPLDPPPSSACATSLSPQCHHGPLLPHSLGPSSTSRSPSLQCHPSSAP